jgi:hypothetical protein
MRRSPRSKYSLAVMSSEYLSRQDFTYKYERGVLVQAGRDVVLPIVKSPPDIKLVRLTIDEDEAQQGCTTEAQHYCQE